jgi:hypothetical protein
MSNKDDLLNTQRRGSIFGTDPTQTHLNKKMVTADDKPDTIKIYKDVMEQVRLAQEVHQHNPSLESFATLNFWKNKLAQYSARERSRKQS